MGDEDDLGAVRPDSGEMPGSDPLWRVRIRGHSGGAILGAGILLGDDRVLTCAHVVCGGGRFAVEFTSVPTAPPVEAEIVAGCVVAEQADADGDKSGDVALLRLARPRPAGHAAVLHRVPPVNRRVTMHGYPDGFNGGVTFRAELGGRCGLDGRVQMFPRTNGELVRPGFSGAGVVDELTGRVIGMVVSRFADREGLRLSFMIPTETILRHLPVLRPRASGAAAVDPSAVAPAQGADVDRSLAQELASWLRDGGEPVKVAVVGGTPGRAAALSRVIGLADRELAAEVRHLVPASASVPPAGSLDLAIDVRGHTVDEVATRIADRLDLPELPGRPAQERIGTADMWLTVAVIGLDGADDPAALLAFLEALTDHGGRLLLAFDDAHAAAALLVTRTAGLLAGVPERSRRLLDLRPLVVAGTEAADRALEQAGFLRQVTGAWNPEAGGRVPVEQLWRRERAARRVLAHLDEAVNRLTALVARRDELRNRLECLHALHHGEDIEEATRYRAAHDLLWSAPCDLAGAEDAVRRCAKYAEEQAWEQA